MTQPYVDRTRRLQDRLASHDADGVVLTASPNLFYCTGFWETQMERHLLGFVAESGDPVLVAPSIYSGQLAEETWITDVRTYGDEDDPTSEIRDVAADLGLTDGHLLLDPTMWARFTHDLRSTLPDATFGLAEDAFASLRITKDATELDAIRRASTIADGVIEDLRRMGESILGTTESELATTIETMLSEGGGTEPAFDIIVGAGPNGASPHHHHSDRVIQPGDPVVLDFGTRVDHYPSDQTRTLMFGGTPPDGFDDAFEAVREAQEAAIRAIQPGITAGDVDDVARSIIEEHGYGDRFIHRTGHGVGLDVHEQPYIVGGNDLILEKGMVFSVEPGVYLDGEYGIRIEDLVAVTGTGSERLNTTDRGYRTTTQS
ncbi:Xaa-Pro aminopeptidase [Halanaeroarchaeum sp. HSR-CO]|uniref:M24 family metallopeptidase n=1 Tax=Halanaeroarchaeum sp. HSR-CO TaxID=2866382 RepID=UPI00217EB29A|nr:Xaa-Pro peptidase family protein [Halanaeroarchaeum sp. HSR-CO]UWG47661.1 Xaa-Pro aminopeptidase [Halanaeroarchaeum sp. HSR-CO]